MLGSYLNDLLGALDEIACLDCLREHVGKWLFYVAIFTCPDDIRAQFGMLKVSGCDHHAIDVFASQHLFGVFIGLWLQIEEFLHLRRSMLACQCPDIADRYRLNGDLFRGEMDHVHMPFASVPATKLALKKSGLTLDQMDVIESNEAFAAQALAVARGLEFDMSKVNPNGGAIALGHPIGCSGAFLATKAVYELHRTGKRYALVTMCIGGGQGIAAVFERL